MVPNYMTHTLYGIAPKKQRENSFHLLDFTKNAVPGRITQRTPITFNCCLAWLSDLNVSPGLGRENIFPLQSCSQCLNRSCPGVAQKKGRHWGRPAASILGTSGGGTATYLFALQVDINETMVFLSFQTPGFYS